MKRTTKRIWIALLAVTVLGLGAARIFAAPGDSGDPLVTLSYIESVLLPSLSEKIGQSAAFQVVEVEQGKRVICEAGTELILRKGGATAITTEKGGLANVTSGEDLKDGEAIPPNALLIVPVSDGRGAAANDDIILMIKGKYSIVD
ncbi:MAG: hypothetical protein LBH54_03485 [Clostridiales bacterium]|jgi:hypothetical protein|nr:hypothetical protein [Clostridiales bacterium]